MKRSIMHNIRFNALRVLVYQNEDRGWSTRHSMSHIIDWCLRKEFAAGEHAGAQNPYC